MEYSNFVAVVITSRPTAKICSYQFDSFCGQMLNWFFLDLDGEFGACSAFIMGRPGIETAERCQDSAHLNNKYKFNDIEI